MMFSKDNTNFNGECFQVYTSLDALTKDIQAIIEGVLIPGGGAE